ncbi:MAG: hypothetical protein KDC98_14480 [Planctomycetes bacterium]|nr:hypothetical protein [Planctomycetota bacterium]
MPRAPGVSPLGIWGWRSPFHEPSPVHVPGPAYIPSARVPYYPYYWRYRPVVQVSEDRTEQRPIEVPPYTAPRELALRFGDPTVGTDEDVRGDWVIDPVRSAAVMKAWLGHLLRSYGSSDEPDLTELENDFREIDARLSIAADGSYSLSLQDKERAERIAWDGGWKFAAGVLDLQHATDVDGIPVESEAIYEFNYYRNSKFTGLVVVNHGLGLVLTRQ